MSPSLSVSLTLGNHKFIGGGTDLPITDGLVLQLDAQDTASIVQDVPGRVRQWTDKSGNGNHAVQNSAAVQPIFNTSGLINGHDTVQSTGTHWMNTLLRLSGVTTTGEMSYFVVFKAPSSFLSQRGLIGAFKTLGGTNAFQALHLSGLGQMSFGMGTTNDVLTVGESPVANANALTSFVAQGPGVGPGTGYSVWMDGVNVIGALPYNFSVNNNFIGVLHRPIDGFPSSPYLGAMGEFVVYNRDLSGAERITIQNFLNTKWGL